MLELEREMQATGRTRGPALGVRIGEMVVRDEGREDESGAAAGGPLTPSSSPLTNFVSISRL